MFMYAAFFLIVVWLLAKTLLVLFGKKPFLLRIEGFSDVAIDVSILGFALFSLIRKERPIVSLMIMAYCLILIFK